MQRLPPQIILASQTPRNLRSAAVQCKATRTQIPIWGWECEKESERWVLLGLNIVLGADESGPGSGRWADERADRQADGRAGGGTDGMRAGQFLWY
ncbi:hypothetical protein AVDCRST_MAG81-2557, partial [uncultured Synechococcales cyanobacterium]